MHLFLGIVPVVVVRQQIIAVNDSYAGSFLAHHARVDCTDTHDSASLCGARRRSPELQKRIGVEQIINVLSRGSPT